MVRRLWEKAYRIKQKSEDPLMSSKSTKEGALPAVAEHRAMFEGSPDGSLNIDHYEEIQTRAELCEDVACVWSDPQALCAAMADCEPLAEAVHSIYSDIRRELEAEVAEAQMADGANGRRHVALQARLRAMPQEAENGAEPWVLALTSREFDAWISPEIKKWFAKGPNGVFESEYLLRLAALQGDAFDFFVSVSSDQRETLGVRVIEGDASGSSF